MLLRIPGQPHQPRLRDLGGVPILSVHLAAQKPKQQRSGVVWGLSTESFSASKVVSEKDKGAVISTYICSENERQCVEQMFQDCFDLYR